jgi:hypothetical protein
VTPVGAAVPPAICGYDCEKLRVALVTANLCNDDHTILRLALGLHKIEREYRLQKVATDRMTASELAHNVSLLHGAAITLGQILEADLDGLREIETLLSGFGFNSIPFNEQVHRFVDALQQVSWIVGQEAALQRQNMRRHHEEPETKLYRGLYHLYRVIAKTPRGLGAPFHRFAQHCCPLLSNDIVIGEELAFLSLVRAALKREKAQTSQNQPQKSR